MIEAFRLAALRWEHFQNRSTRTKPSIFIEVISLQSVCTDWGLGCSVISMYVGCCFTNNKINKAISSSKVFLKLAYPLHGGTSIFLLVFLCKIPVHWSVQANSLISNHLSSLKSAKNVPVLLQLWPQRLSFTHCSLTWPEDTEIFNQTFQKEKSSNSLTAIKSLEQMCV